MADQIKWECSEVIGIAPVNFVPVCEMPITDEVWEVICEKAAAVGMDPEAWLEQEVDRLNKEIE